ncbi:MAG: Mpo1-like protein [Gemmataceae bacterium]
MSQPETMTFEDFYKTYQALHQTRICRGLHVVGVVLGALALAYGVLMLDFWVLVGVPLVGYALAWIGHFVFEGNCPATFGHPVFSFRADLHMTWAILTGKEHLDGRIALDHAALSEVACDDR